jgi:hypothetical protein
MIRQIRRAVGFLVALRPSRTSPLASAAKGYGFVQIQVGPAGYLRFDRSERRPGLCHKAGGVLAAF